MPDGVYQRGTRLYVSYYAPCTGSRHDDGVPCGQQHQEREPAKRQDGTPVQTVKEAVKYRQARLVAVTNHRTGVQPFQGPRAERILFTELLDQYECHADIHDLKSLPQIRSRCKRLRIYFAGYRTLAVTRDVLLRYAQARQAEGAANATINRETEVIARAFALAVVAGKLAFAPKVPSLREDNARQGFFARGDFEAVMKHIADDDVRDFIEFFFWTGMRNSEIRSLGWGALDKETWTLRLHASDAKTGHGRVLVLVDELRAIIERRWQARTIKAEDGTETICPLIFHRAGRPMGEFKKLWATACKAAGFAPVTEERAGKKIVRPAKRVYDLRRTAARNMRQAGVHEKTIMSITGHRTRSMFDRYNIVDENDLRDAVAKTSAYVATLPATSNVIPLRAESRQ
jgi:integrase